MLFIRIYQKYL